MKTTILLSPLFLLLASCAATQQPLQPSTAAVPISAAAQSDVGEPIDAAAPINAAADPSGNYFGFKMGPLFVSRDLPYDDGVSIGILLGQYVADSNWAIEGELTTTVSSLDADAGFLGDLDIFTLGGFGVYRTEGDLYLKAKGGLVYEYLDASVGNTRIDGGAVNIALGVGGGYRISDELTAEIEYTRIDPDINFLSFGVNFGI